MTLKKQATRFTTTGRGPEGSRGAIWEHFGGVLGVIFDGFGSRFQVDLAVLFDILCRYLLWNLESV